MDTAIDTGGKLEPPVTMTGEGVREGVSLLVFAGQAEEGGRYRTGICGIGTGHYN